MLARTAVASVAGSPSSTRRWCCGASTTSGADGATAVGGAGSVIAIGARHADVARDAAASSATAEARSARRVLLVHALGRRNPRPLRYAHSMARQQPLESAEQPHDVRARARLAHE